MDRVWEERGAAWGLPGDSERQAARASLEILDTLSEERFGPSKRLATKVFSAQPPPPRQPRHRNVIHFGRAFVLF